MEENRLEENMPQRFKLTGSVPAKVAAVLIMFASIVLCVLGAAGCFAAVQMSMYTSTYRTAQENGLHSMAYQVARRMYDYFDSDYEVSARQDLRGNNAEAAILEVEDRLAPDSSVFLWQSYERAAAREENGFYSDLYVDINMPYFPFFDEDAKNQAIVVRVFFDPDFTLDDDIRIVARLVRAVYEYRYTAVVFCAAGALLFLTCGIFLLCAAGHRNGREGIVPGIFTRIPLDVLTAGFIAVLGLIANLLIELHGSPEISFMIFGGFVLISCIIYLWDFAIRVKLGKLWRNTLVCRVFRFLWRMLRMGCRVIAQIPLVWSTVAVCLAICFLELMGIARYTQISDGGLLLWMLEKLLLFAVVLYIALMVRKLLETSRKLAEGHADHRVDTKYMFGAFKEQGENLNSLGQGVTRAVAERMKSERLKTELITNVSHDLKTPLTSIINYAELIGREAGDSEENAALREYAEVLLRQSGRLKRLLDNLVEASKAVTGNLEVNLEPCEAGVLLSQAVGEYQQRLEERALELRVSQPEEPVKILADGRHMWRVFDNLLNNICKYAQEGSRVYLTMDKQEGKALLIFRNMSRYALDISPAELEERFVRGDKSRHLEGNGLGLSIAKSLTQLQGGQMDIVIDGDLFKVTLAFEVLKES